MDVSEFSKYERARILGARALQIAMNAPLLIKIEKQDLEKIHYDALKIAEIELNSNILPISIKKPFPQRRKKEILAGLHERLQNAKPKGPCKKTQSKEKTILRNARTT